MDVEGTCELYLAADFYLFNDEANQFKPVERQVTVQINNLTEGKNFKCKSLATIELSLY